MQIVFQNPDSALNRRLSIRRIIAPRADDARPGPRARDAEARLRELAHSVRLRRAADPSSGRRSSPAASSSAWRSRARSPATRASWCATSRRRRSTSRCRRRSSTCSPSCRREKGTRVPVHLARPRRRALPVRPHRRALPRAADGARAGGDGLRPAAPPVHRGAAVGGARGGRHRAAADPARGRDPQRTRTRRRAACSTRAARATSATSAASRSRELKEVEPGHFWRCHYSGRGAARAPGSAAPGERRRSELRVRAAVLERAGAPLELAELELADRPARARCACGCTPAASATRTSTRSTGRAETRCPAVLGHEGAGVVEAVGDGVALAPGTRVALSWMPACGRCEECLRELPHLCSAAWPAMEHGGLLDGTPRLSRDGEPVFHYSYLSAFAERAVVPGVLLRADPRRRAVRRSPRSSAARSPPAPARSGAPRACGPASGPRCSAAAASA